MQFNIGDKHQVLCADGTTRTASITAPPETMWTVPASVRVARKTVHGWLWQHANTQQFCFSRTITAPNFELLPPWKSGEVTKRELEITANG